MASTVYCNCACTYRGASAKTLISFITKQMQPTSFTSKTIRRACKTSAVLNNAEMRKPKKKRDRLTVLKALSSTVEEIPNRPDYRFYDDIILNPRSLTKQKEMVLAMESGSKAADFVIETYPHLFPLREPVPAWSDSDKLTVEDSPENLKLLLKRKEHSNKVLELYYRLKNTAEVEIDIHNQVLDFIIFHGIDQGGANNTSVVDRNNEDDISSSSSSSSSDEEADTKVNAKAQEEKIDKTIWRSDGYGETLFTELKDRASSQTYEIFILGLLQHGEYIRAFHLFQEFKNKEFKGGLFFYNTLLTHVCDVREESIDRWDLVQEITGYMKKVSVLPNSVTFTSILGVASESTENPMQLCQEVIREMKSLKIMPSLGCFTYMLMVDRKQRQQDIQVLYPMLNDIKKGEVDFNLLHPLDLNFFHLAMELARYKRNVSVVKNLYDIVLSNKLQHLLGTCRSSFFGNYLCAIARDATDLNALFQEYENIVPKYLVPREWVYQQMFLALRNHQKPDQVPRLYADMVSMRVPQTDRLSQAIYQAMDENVPKERIKEFVHVALDAKKWFEVFNVKMTSEISSTIIKLLCMGEKYNDAKNLIDEISKQGIYPSQQAMTKVLELNLLQEDKTGAMHSLKTISSFGMKLTNEINDMIESNEIFNNERDRIQSLFLEN